MLKRIGRLCAVFMLAAVVVAVGCKGKAKKAEDGAPTDGATKKAYVSKGDEGTISGKVSFEGDAPAPKKIDMSQDANCAGSAGDKSADDLLVAEGKLANVFVYLKGGPVDQNSFATPSEPVVLDQVGCRYHPRVLGIQTNQTLKVTNSDNTTHNVHPSPKTNQEWNQMQAQGAPAIEKKFARAETLIPVKCNQHPWMKANIGVLGHPYFAVSAKDGSYTIKNVPPGSYTLVFWHETKGEQTQQVTIAAKESKTQDITYKAGATARATSMEVGPALILP
ncbi:MAG TPA: carboxypeptidase regulatory-like domain-containing protein [Blastocatellia bacterium]|nr:carboxypeptidase regulatory-like domain-containing protein [Blastocatellia bacterium]